ncbi:hypothetical protein [[Limnothrix rosea] IAM M-220]|uniref:hypothetical protein n=1 Tax=[Limnothrix rosea] IAM M-220 TaxID=454133 RepID=UPI001C0D0E33|nr:hypothetical protein [[Limnothrix rosea] IAM M-220]
MATIVMLAFCVYLVGIINRAFYLPLVKTWAQRTSLQLIKAQYKVIYKNKRNRWRVQSRSAPTFQITARRADGQILKGFVKFKLKKMTLLGADDLANYQVIVDWKS